MLVLHGSGSSNRTRHGYIRDALAKDGIATAAVDFIGHGDTGGELLGSSLHERTEVAQATIDYLKMKEPFGVIGSSMGAYTAVKLTESYKINGLVLIVPAVYTTVAYDIPFGSAFTEKLHAQNSWQNSDAWEIISRFTGKLLIIAAEHDDQIPAEIPKKYMESAVQAKSKQLFVVPGATHRVREVFIEKPQEFDRYYRQIHTTLTNT